MNEKTFSRTGRSLTKNAVKKVKIETKTEFRKARHTLKDLPDAFMAVSDVSNATCISIKAGYFFFFVKHTWNKVSMKKGSVHTTFGKLT
jgi:outer membrane protease